MKILAHVLRIIVAITFIFSGFVKLVDPIGSEIKMKEYLAADVLHMPFLIPYALILAILLILAELTLGVMLLVGFKPKWTLAGITILMLVFLFLTWYSAYFNKVADCGCFGDALKLSPWETFYKNVVLVFFVGLLWLRIKDIKAWFGQRLATWIPFLSFIASLYVSYYVLKHLPIIDFTPYKVGASIPEGMQYKDGQEIPDIHDFIFENESEDLTESILQAEKVLLIISVNLAESDMDNFNKIKDLTDLAKEKGYLVYALSASSMEDFDFIKQKYKLDFDMLWGDSTTLKTMIRANPGIMMLKKGVITGKWNTIDAHKVTL